jgi:hypothetical protein
MATSSKPLILTRQSDMIISGNCFAATLPENVPSVAGNNFYFTHFDELNIMVNHVEASLTHHGTRAIIAKTLSVPPESNEKIGLPLPLLEDPDVAEILSGHLNPTAEQKSAVANKVFLPQGHKSQKRSKHELGVVFLQNSKPQTTFRPVNSARESCFVLTIPAYARLLRFAVGQYRRLLQRMTADMDNLKNTNECPVDKNLYSIGPCSITNVHCLDSRGMIKLWITATLSPHDFHPKIYLRYGHHQQESHLGFPVFARNLQALAEPEAIWNFIGEYERLPLEQTVHQHNEILMIAAAGVPATEDATIGPFERREAAVQEQLFSSILDISGESLLNQSERLSLSSEILANAVRTVFGFECSDGNGGNGGGGDGNDNNLETAHLETPYLPQHKHQGEDPHQQQQEYQFDCTDIPKSRHVTAASQRSSSTTKDRQEQNSCYSSNSTKLASKIAVFGRIRQGAAETNSIKDITAITKTTNRKKPTTPRKQRPSKNIVSSGSGRRQDKGRSGKRLSPRGHSKKLRDEKKAKATTIVQIFGSDISSDEEVARLEKTKNTN